MILFLCLDEVFTPIPFGAAGLKTRRPLFDQRLTARRRQIISRAE